MKIKLIIGIGNPGKVYAETYHNAGIMFTEWFAARIGGPAEVGLQHKAREWLAMNKVEWKNLKLFSYVICDTGPIICKSDVFMNESGKAVMSAMKKFGLSPGEIAVAQDESDIELGKYKLSFDSRSAGHRGIESIITSLRTQSFYRIRIGIRKREGKAMEFVLRKLNKEDKNKLEESFESAIKRINPFL